MQHFTNQVLWMIQQLFAMILEEDAEAQLNDEDKASYKETKTIPTNFKEKKATCKRQSFYILLTCLLITTAFTVI